MLLGVTGGIAAYKALELTRLATKAGHAVRVIQTRGGERFVGAAVVRGDHRRARARSTSSSATRARRLPRRPGARPRAARPPRAGRARRRLPDRAGVGQHARQARHGLADNLVTAAALAGRRPLLVAPAMNDAMWEHPATQANLAMLRARGVDVLEPGTGALGSLGEAGVGRLPEPPELLAAVEAAFAGGADLAGVRVLITAGGTREPIDAVRFVGNRSSGRMGFALRRGRRTPRRRGDLVAANVALPRRAGHRLRRGRDRRRAGRRGARALRRRATSC